MSARNYTQTLGAGDIIRLPAGVYFYIRTAASALDVSTEGNPGSPLRFTGIGAGAKFGPLPAGQGWKFLVVSSAAAQAIEIVISDDGLFELSSSVSVTGGVTTQETPSSAVATPAAGSRATGGADTIAANLSRRRISICAPSTNTGSLFVQAVGAGAGRGVELQPGTTLEFKTTAALDIRNDSGATQAYSTFEET